MKTQATALAILIASTLSSTPTLAESTINKFINNTSMEGVIEIEAGFSDDFSGASSSQIEVATVELVFDSKINKNISSHILLLHEADTALEVDEASISIDISNGTTVTAGQLYLPFGNYETNMISDSLPHEFSEVRETAIQLDYEVGAISSSVYLFNGSVLETGADESIDSFGFNLAYEADNVTVGMSYTNNLTDGDLITDSITDPTAVTSYTAGLSIYSTASLGSTSVFFEYVTALDEMIASDLSNSTVNAEPSTINLEVGFELKDAMFAIAYQTTDEAAAFDLPESRLMLSYSMDVMKDTSLAFEIASDTDYADENASAITIQLATSF